MAGKKAQSKSDKITTKEVEEYELLRPLLVSLLEEVKELSKKKQDGVLNLLKVKMINKLLIRIKELLKKEAASEFIELLDEETMPTNSDALFMLVQFQTALQQYYSKYYIYEPGTGHFWNTSD